MDSLAGMTLRCLHVVSLFLMHGEDKYKPSLSYIVMYRISSVIKRSFFLPKQSKRSRSVLQDGSRSFGLFRKG